ncbi:MAG: hypothetical protein ACK5O8_15095 [Pirellula sp.]
MAQSSANTYEENLFAQGERLDSHAVRKQPITAIEYEYRSAEYEYEYEKQPSASRTSHPSYSVRNADGTRARTRARTRCSELASMMSGAMSGATVMIQTGLESLREPKQPTAAIEYEKCLAPGFSSPPYDNFLVFDKA